MEISYEIIRSARKTLAIQITPEGKVLVRCPQRMKTADVRKFVESKSSWLQAHLAKYASAPPASPLAEAEMHSLSQAAAQAIPERVAFFAQRMGVSYGRITLRWQRSRWGSCSGKGNLNFNCLLMLAPPEVLDYVVVHELCHRKEMNHSPKFWAAVEAVLPDYRERRQWLKEKGNGLLCRLPK